MIPRLITPPAVEPVSLSDLKSHLAVTHADEDARLSTLLAVARMLVERTTRRRLISQTWRLTLDRIPEGGVLALPLQPVQTVSAVRVADAAGAFTTFPLAGVLLDLADEPARLVFGAGVPTPGRAVAGIEIDLVAGYGPTADAVPAPLAQAVRLLAAHWYAARGTEPDAAIPADVATLIAGYRVTRIAA